jgi:hypothetical protein
MDPSSLVTTRVAMTMVAWTYFRSKSLPHFELIEVPNLRAEIRERLWSIFQKQLGGWDRYVILQQGQSSDILFNNWLTELNDAAETQVREALEIDHGQLGIQKIINDQNEKNNNLVN